MSETMVEVTAPVTQAGPANISKGAIPPPPRRPRVREVSSRFMSPVVSSSSSGDLHLLNAKSPITKPQNFSPGSNSSAPPPRRGGDRTWN